MEARVQLRSNKSTVILYLKLITKNETESLGIECDKTIYDKMTGLKFKMNVDIESCTNKFSCWYKGNVRLTYLGTNTRHNSVTGNNERYDTTISFPMKVVDHKKTVVNDKGEITSIDDFKGKKFWNGGKIHRRRRSKKSKKSKKGTRRR